MNALNCLRRLAVVAFPGLVLAACATLQVGSDYDRSASFTGYHQFALMPRTRTAANPLVAQRAQDAIQAELAAKGFVYVADAATADFVVDFAIGARDRVDIASYPAPYAGMYWGRGWWGYPYWGDQVDVRQYKEGTLSIDVFDARTHKPIWHGWAKKELSQSDMARSERPIRDAVNAVLQRFPPG